MLKKDTLEHFLGMSFEAGDLQKHSAMERNYSILYYVYNYSNYF
jgi:hypothetical protein